MTNIGKVDAGYVLGRLERINNDGKNRKQDWKVSCVS